MCLFGRCEAGCYHPAQQRADYSANDAATSQCLLFAGSCPRCGVEPAGCFNNYCRTCEVDGHCGAGQTCIDYVCSP